MRFWQAFGLMQIGELPMNVLASIYGNPPIFGAVGNQIFWLIFSAFVAACAAENVKEESK
jgi:hypothetical protein